eukprot:TRINITY_DN7163_c0_g1_i1.p1 TRINITY_DN7163_c0_g1~~TRINITY_DN7163_c0_g1_i1.p1  ORF type:complete len:121 (+),score=2.77 TRINITY_DN7163_c0_g1_i1:120-482(+)
MLNICCLISLPAIPKETFDLVLTTCSYNSVLIETAQNDELKDSIDLEELANEVFSKNGTNIRASFESVLHLKYGTDHTSHYFVVADRASENPVAFGRRYLCCWAHALDIAFKFGLKELRK